MWSVPQALATLTLIAFGAIPVIIVAGVWQRVVSAAVPARTTPLERVWAHGRDSALSLAWVAALVATLGSLYLSEIAHYPPCTLCWLQRIAMYPLVVVLGISAIRDDRDVRWYALPLAGIGAGLAFYHALVQRVPSLQQSTSCSADAPCNVMWLREFGFVSIPVMALGAFLLIAVLLLVGATASAGDVAGGGRKRRGR